MSDDWNRYRSDLDGEDEDAAAEDKGSEEPGGWADDEPSHHKTHWEDDEPESGGESESGWPTPGSTWQRPGYGDTQRPWGESDEPGYGDYGYTPREDLFADDAAQDRYAAPHSRDPLARLFPGLPRGVRVTLDWILTIAGAILIVLALKQWVVNPYRIPSSSMEPTLNCAKGAANPGCLGNSSDRVLACRICLDFGHNPSRGDIVVFNTPTRGRAQVRRRRNLREARHRPPGRQGARGRPGLHLHQEPRGEAVREAERAVHLRAGPACRHLRISASRNTSRMASTS